MIRLWTGLALTAGVVVVLRVALTAVEDAWQAHPILMIFGGCLATFLTLGVVATVLDRRDELTRRTVVRRASEEFGPRPTPSDPYREESVDHVVHHVVHHHVVEHVHRYEGEATVRHEHQVTHAVAPPVWAPGRVIEGEVVRRRAIGGGAA